MGIILKIVNLILILNICNKSIDTKKSPILLSIILISLKRLKLSELSFQY